MTTDYKEKLFTFLDHPWQEDTEIQLIALFDEYRDDMKDNPDGCARNYLNSMVKENNLFGNQMLSDSFTTTLSELI